MHHKIGYPRRTHLIRNGQFSQKAEEVSLLFRSERKKTAEDTNLVASFERYQKKEPAQYESAHKTLQSKQKELKLKKERSVRSKDKIKLLDAKQFLELTSREALLKTRYGLTTLLSSPSCWQRPPGNIAHVKPRFQTQLSPFSFVSKYLKIDTYPKI